MVILDEVKPYRGGNTSLWELNKLDNIDKHNLILRRSRHKHHNRSPEI